MSRLVAEAVQGAALSLEGVDHIHCSDSLAASVLTVGHGITDHVFQEDLQDTTNLLVDQATDALHTTTASQAADCGLSDALNVVAKNLAMALGTTLSQTFASLSTSRHD